MTRTQQIFAQGSLTNTGEPTDVALSGDGFFVVEGNVNGVIDQLRAIAGVQVAAVIREPRAGGGALKKVSLRSAQPDVDVARIAHAGGGGGHAMAAGFAMEGSFADVIALIEAAFAGV